MRKRTCWNAIFQRRTWISTRSRISWSSRIRSWRNRKLAPKKDGNEERCKKTTAEGRRGKKTSAGESRDKKNTAEGRRGKKTTAGESRGKKTQQKGGAAKKTKETHSATKITKKLSTNDSHNEPQLTTTGRKAKRPSWMDNYSVPEISKKRMNYYK